MTGCHAASSKVHSHSSYQFSPSPVASFGSTLPWTLPLAFYPTITSDAERDWRQPWTLGWELTLHSTQATSCRATASISISLCGSYLCSVTPKLVYERLPTFVEPWARMTIRCCQQITSIGLATCGKGGARLAARLGMQTTRPTILRRIMGLPDVSGSSVVYLGIDDFAF